MRACKACGFPALIGSDYGGNAPIPCAFCGGELGDWMHRDSAKATAIRRKWFQGGGRQLAEKLRAGTARTQGSGT